MIGQNRLQTDETVFVKKKRSDEHVKWKEQMAVWNSKFQVFWNEDGDWCLNDCMC